MKDHSHIQRISKELKTAGMTPYGLIKIESQHLPDIIHENEHIHGVVYGLYEKSIDSVMMVATDRRVLFIDCKPFYQNVDEITYEVVAGVDTSIAGPFASITLHTRVQNFKIRFVNIKCAIKFEEYIEEYIERNGKTSPVSSKELEELKKYESPYQPYRIPDKKLQNPINNGKTKCSNLNTAVMSTIGKDGAHGSVVHYVNDKDENFYVVIKSDSHKARNIQYNNRVSLVMHRSNSLKYLSVLGVAELVQDKSIFDMVISIVTSIKEYEEGTKMPPITKLTMGKYLVLKITPTKVQNIDYSSSSW